MKEYYKPTQSVVFVCLRMYFCVCMFVLMPTEQLKELNQELIKHEEQLREVKKNSTTLEKKLEYERCV